MKTAKTIDFGGGWRISYTARLDGATGDAPRIVIELRNEGTASPMEFYNLSEGYLSQFGDDARITDTTDDGNTITATIDCTKRALMVTIASMIGGGEQPSGATA